MNKKLYVITFHTEDFRGSYSKRTIIKTATSIVELIVIGGPQMDICEMDMADIRRTLEMASTREIVLDKAKCTIGSVEYFKRGTTHE